MMLDLNCHYDVDQEPSGNFYFFFFWPECDSYNS